MTLTKNLGALRWEADDASLDSHSRGGSLRKATRNRNYLRKERRHKEAIHTVISTFLSEENLKRPDFSDHLAELSGNTSPDTRKLGLSEEAHHSVYAKLKDSTAATFRHAIASL